LSSFLNRLRERGPRVLLLLGIAVRILTYAFLYPENNDKHAEVVRFIAENGKLPLAIDLMQAQHPPLYYLLVTPLWAFSGSLKVVQLFSLACSIATLIVLYSLIYREGLIEDARARLYSFLIACFLPQFVMFTLYISNDTLTCLLGAVAVRQTYRYIRSPNWKQLILLAAVIGLGLSTKFTFLAFIPILFGLILWVSWSLSPARAAGAACAFLAIVLALGSYKFVENYLNEGDAFRNGMDDPRWDLANQRESYRGVSSYLDVNIMPLLEEPVFSATTGGSYPVVLYASFWYQFIPESNWDGNLHRHLQYLGSAIYALALIPTAFFLVGLVVLGVRLPEFGQGFDPARPEDQRLLTLYVAVAGLLTVLVMMLFALTKYHVWSIMQGRFLFPVLFGGLAAFAVGVETVSRFRIAAIALQVAMVLLVGLFGLYYASEITLRLLATN
jgi:4-amino-4-deoxy-L-arabinose transferase-like glycosyltransferase